jgi:ABC-type antimicrobial peptide transport system permease subunit
VPAAVGLSRFLASLLYAVEPHDPTTFAAIATLIFAVALAACVLPARRALRLDPVKVLRAE